MFDEAVRKDLAPLITRVFGTGAVVVALSGLVLAVTAAPGSFQIVGSFAVLGLAALLALASWVASRERLHGAVALVIGSLVVAATLYAAATGLGLRSLMLGTYAIAVAATGVAGGWRASLAVAGLCLALLLGMAQAERAGWLAGPAVLADVTLQARLLAHAALLALAAGTAGVMARLLRFALAASRRQQERFRKLAGLAADWYWEQDAEYRFTLVQPIRSDPLALDPDAVLGKRRWEIPALQPAAGDWAAHRADLQARRSFRDLRLRRREADGGTTHILVSGEPMLDEAGRFTGYWGVARDITAEARANEALGISQMRFRDLFEHSPSAFIVHRAGAILEVNDAAARLLGVDTPQALRGQPSTNVIHPESRALAASRIGQLERMPVGGTLPATELHLVRADGADVFVESSVMHIDLGDGPACLSTLHDLTERKRAALALQRSESLLAHLFESNPDCMTVAEIDTGRLVMANEGCMTMLGYDREQIVGRTSLELGLWVEPQARETMVALLRRDGRLRDHPISLRAADGRQLETLVSAATFEHEGRAYMVSHARDVTQAERDRRAYEAIVAGASVGIAFTRAQRFAHVNPIFEQMFGWPHGGLVGQSTRVVWPDPKTYQQVGDELGARLGAGEPVELERTMRRRDGSIFRCRLRGRAVDPRRPSEGGAIWIAEDVTEKRLAEERLARSEAMLSRLFDASPDYISVSGMHDGRLVMVNDGFTRMTGYTREEAVGRTSFEIGMWHDVRERERLVEGVQREGLVRDMRATMHRRDGRLSPVLFSSASLEIDGQPFLVTTARDVSASEQSRLQYEAMFMNANVGIGFTRNRRIQHVNPWFAQMMGWTPEDLTGQPGTVVWPSVQDHDEVGRLYGPALARGEGVDFERRLRRRDGSLFFARMQARAVDPRNPADGGTIWITEDITERRAADAALAAARDAAEAASRAKSAFLANTSHEIRTPLNGLIGLARLALEPQVTPARQREYLERIDDSARSLAGIISDILDLSKIEAGKFALEDTTFELPPLLDAIKVAYAELARDKNLQCRLDLDPALPVWVHGDPVRLRQIVTNLLSNAIKFTDEGSVKLRAGVDDDGAVRIEVLDTGIGIDPAVVPRLFTPFMQADQSTTRRYGGTGLGLSICQQLAHLMGGEVGVESRPGQGSRFWARLRLPAVDAPQAPPAPAAGEQESLRGLRVLLVEDNPVNMLIAQTLLGNWGVEVITASDGRQAVQAVHEQVDRIDLVLMDVHMPVLSGHDATAEIRRHHSPEELPILALTAAALVSEQAHSMALGMNDFITKPFDTERLRAALLRWGRRRPAPARR